MTTLNFEQRFIEALSILCGGRRPELQIVKDWFNTNLDSLELQAWAIENGPEWAQGIAVIDAARLLAGQPPDGCGYAADAPDDSHRVRILVTVDVDPEVPLSEVSSLGAYAQNHLRVAVFNAAECIPISEDLEVRRLTPNDLRVSVQRHLSTF